jgi:hypothetical protein
MFSEEPESIETTIEPAFSFSQKSNGNVSSVLYKKMKREDAKPYDAFNGELSLQTIFSKLAIISFFLFVISVGAVDLKALTTASLAGFIMFSAFYGFLRIRNI